MFASFDKEVQQVSHQQAKVPLKKEKIYTYLFVAKVVITGSLVQEHSGFELEGECVCPP